MQAHKDMFLHLVRGDGDSAEKHREFYDEYLAVMDLTAEFYLQTVDTVFVQHLLPRGLMTHRGRAVDLAAIRRPALMTVEGEKDDITGAGQCRAAHALCPRIAPERRVHFECPRVGHYGIFNGRRFRSEIAPRIAKFLRAHDPCADTGLSIAQLEHMSAMPQRGPRPQELETLAFSFPRYP
jgi:poly(3-hydroxybutyrate) depolymerase